MMNRYLEDRLRRRYWGPRTIEHARRVMRSQARRRPLVLRMLEFLFDYVNLLAGVVLIVGTAFFVFPLLLLPEWYGYGLFIVGTLVMGILYGAFALDIFLLEKAHHLWIPVLVFASGMVAMWFVCVQINEIAHLLGIPVYYTPFQVSLSYALIFLLPLLSLLARYRAYIFGKQ